jgi:putative N6-adenine-specific DNA methylase
MMYDSMQETVPTRKTRVTCAPGLAPYVKAELESLGFEILSMDRTGVEINATTADAMKLNLHLRTAFHVLQRFADIHCKDADELYSESTRLPWDRVIKPDGYISIVSTVRNESINNSMFPNMRLKDAIVDKLSKETGRRPDSGSSVEQAVINLHWVDDKARIYLNLSGRKLSDRGYRRIPCKAPMRETIAAAVLQEMQYDGSRPLVVPMCGSGTIGIEAALMAQNRAPGLLRGNFAFMHLLNPDLEEWGKQRLAAKKTATKNELAPIVMSDNDPECVEAARKNAVTAGVEHLIDFHVCDFAETPLPEETGDIILHGEYGKRLGDDSLIETYSRIGDYLKQQCAGWDGYVFTSGKPLMSAVGLKVAKRTPFFNAEFDCRLLRYELYVGSREVST